MMTAGSAKKKYLFGLFTKWVDSKGPSYGEVCTVTGEEDCEDCGPCYFLAEWPGDSYAKTEFIPIQDEEVMETVENEIQVKNES